MRMLRMGIESLERPTAGVGGRAGGTPKAQRLAGRQERNPAAHGTGWRRWPTHVCGRD